MLYAALMPKQAKTSEVLQTRQDIKAQLPRLYDFFWEECDRGKFFFIPLRKRQRKKFRAETELLVSGSTSIQLSYGDFIEHAAMALSANRLANSLDSDGFANHFRFDVRNRHT